MGVHLVTGFPGFIASQLVRQLFHDNINTHIYAVVLPTELGKAQKEVANICAYYSNCQIELLEGDITLPDLGLEANAIEKIIERVEVVWHLAAIYDLAVPREAAWKVNVHGTANVNEFVKKLPSLERYMYFSTAYIAGRRDGVLLETELVRPDAFKNYYEETKFEAELRVDDLKTEVPLTILRLGIVCGHSQTGEITKFDGPYFFMNLIDNLRNWPCIPFVGSKTATINVVPIDYVVKVATYLWRKQEAKGKTVHVTDPHPHTVEAMFYTMVKEMTGKKSLGRLPLNVTKKCLENLTLRKRLGIEYETVDYLNWHAEFDCREAQALLDGSHIVCPDYIDVLPKLVQFYQHNKHHKELFVAVK